MSFLRFHTRVRGTMFVRNGAMTPGLSRECDTCFVKGQICFVKGQPRSARQLRDSTVAVRRVQSVAVSSSRVSRECRSPGLNSILGSKECPRIQSRVAQRFTSLNIVNFRKAGFSADFLRLSTCLGLPNSTKKKKKVQIALGSRRTANPPTDHESL